MTQRVSRFKGALVRTEALIALRKSVSPNPTNKDCLVFRERLARVMRWYKVSQLLVWGNVPPCVAENPTQRKAYTTFRLHSYQHTAL